MKKEQEKLPVDELKKSGEVTRRDFLVGAGTVVVGGAIGAGLLSSCGETVTTTVKETSTKTVPTTITAPGTTVTETKTVAGEDGEVITVTETKTVTQPGGGTINPADEPEDTYLHMHCMAGFGSGGELGEFDVKNGKIVRIRPLHIDKNYTSDEIAPSVWKIEARGKSFSPPLKGLPSYFACAYKKHIYSPNRVKYPLQRVDWEPGGVNVNSQNRGKSKFKRISWDQAASMIASEIKRVQGTYGDTSIMLCGDGHGEGKNIHSAHGCQFAMFDSIGVQYTTSVRNPDSWEGWFYGGMHFWGQGFVGMQALGMGAMADNGAALQDVIQNSDMIVWYGDWETTPQGFNGQCASLFLFFLGDLGIRNIWIGPDLNYAAAVHAYKWIPVLPNTDSAMLLAIAYTWIMEGTYDQDYLDTHTVGWDTFKAYVMGESDDMKAKTPEWAAPKCGVPAYTIKALAREWAAKKTSTGHYYGGAGARGPYSHEVARLEATLLTMQGLGGPGIQQIYNRCGKSTVPRRAVNPAPGTSGAGGGYALSKQNIPKTLHQDAILYHDKDNPLEWWGSSSQFAMPADQLKKYTYPVPDGGSEIHMIWSDTVCHTACWPEANVRIEAYRSPKLECIVAQHPTFENDCLYSDIVLPINTVFEEEDILAIAFWINLVNYSAIGHTGPGIQSIGESKSDNEAVREVARKLGEYGNGNVYDLYTKGRSMDELLDYSAVNSNVVIDGTITWEELKEKEYWLAPLAEGWQNDPPAFRAFYDNPEENPLPTPTGKLEIYSQALADTFPDDNERGPYPKYVVGGPDGATDEGVDAEYGSVKYKTYPLLMQSQHPRWRTHVQCDDCTWLREIETCKVRGYDGYMYEPLWIHPKDAEPRGIKNGDIVKVFNDRGIELGGARITERVHPGGVYMDHGSRVDMITTGINRGGTVNTLIPSNRGHKYIPHLQIGSSYLVEVEKLSGEQMLEWRDQYPEAFARQYDPGSGLKFDAWVEGGID